MNIITNYQANKLALKNLRERREEALKMFKEIYEEDEILRVFISSVFENVKKEAEKGFFDYETTLFLENYAGSFEGLRSVFVDALECLGYKTAGYIKGKGISLWIGWGHE